MYKDYAAWILENKEILDKFQKNNSVIYERLEPVYEVLNHIYHLVCEHEEMDQDYNTIFEIGFNYLSQEFDVIKIYFETLFQSNCDDFVNYSQMLLYLIYIYDIRADLENHGIDSDYEQLNELETLIENMIMERRDDYLYISAQMDDTLEKLFSQINYEYVSIIDIYVEIAETMGIFLYEDEEIVLGEEI